MRLIHSGALIGLLMAGVAGTHAESAGTRIQIDTGEVVGMFQLNTAVRAFLGVPFAAPPVGALRWKPPQPAAPWPTARAATSYGARSACSRAAQKPRYIMNMPATSRAAKTACFSMSGHLPRQALEN